MKKEKIFEILLDWNCWEREIDTGIERKGYIKRIYALLKTEQIVSLIGVRRSGKSTLMRQYAKQLIQKGLDARNILYVNLEDPRFFGESIELFQEIYETYLQYMEPDKKPYIFLDEVQNILGWEKFVRAINERGNAHLIVSGSSSKLLSSEFGTVLTGRHLSLDVYPLSFREFLNFNNIEIKSEADIIGKRLKIKSLLNEYMEWGGFPKVVLSEEKRNILMRYFEDIIARDVVERYKIRNVMKLKFLAKFYLTNISTRASFNSIRKFLGISLDSVERFSQYLSDTYLLGFLSKYSYSLKEQIVNPRKVYCIDTGLCNVAGFKFSENIGRLYENLVFIELKRREMEIYYWSGKQEIDFVVKNAAPKLIQVSWNVEDEKTKSREVNALIEGMNEFKLNEGLIITEDYMGEEETCGKTIKYIPLWRWLLG